MAREPALPRSGEAITTDWIQRALTAGGASGLPAIRDMSVDNIGAGAGLLGDLLRCRLSWGGEDPTAPASVIVKLPSSDAKSLRMCRRLSLHKREYEFYRHVGPHAPIRSPALLYGDFDARSHRYVLVLEDLGHMEAGDQVAGATAEQAIRAVRSLARLHGHYWNGVDRPPLSGLHDSLSPKRALLVQLVYLANLAPTFDRFGGYFSDRTLRLAEAYGSRVADHAAEIAAGPRTVTHGDVRMDNMFFGGGEDDFAMIDWQVSGLGCGLYDVAYFLGGSVSVDVRRDIERDALREYCGIVGATAAGNITFDECWRLYRHCILGRLLVSVFVCGGLDVSDGRSRQIAESGLERTLAAIEDLDAGDCLPARRSFFSLANGVSAMFRGAKLYKKIISR